MKKWLCFTLSLLSFYTLLCQEFLNQTGTLNVEHSYIGGYLGGGASFHDFNRDGWPDLTLSSGEGLCKFYQNTAGSFTPVDLIELSGEVKSLIWVDFDNDGDSDLSLTEYNGLFRLYENLGGLEFVEIDLQIAANTPTHNSGISWGDYNNDGFLDFYVCRYPEITMTSTEEMTNLLIRNNGDGTFTDATSNLGVGNGFQHSFMSTWADFDNDGDQDLYVVNDRHNFLNALYRNNGNSTFTDISDESNSDIGILAMSSTVADYDNNGLLDIYCTNSYAGNHLLKNIGNASFHDESPDSGTELYAFTWGAKFVDYDNNGWKDLYVCAGDVNTDNNNKLLQNNEDGTFTQLLNVLPDFSDDSHSVAKGDFNKDGLYDFVILNEAPFNTRILENTNASNHNYITVKLAGVYSNADAIGSRITYYTSGLSQTYYTTCGSDYLSQDAQELILGMGEHTIIDSLHIKWPRGLEEVYYNLEPEETYEFTEGASLTASLSHSGTMTICDDESLVLAVLGNYEGYNWSDLSTDYLIEISTSGTYSAMVHVENFISIPTDSLILTVISSPELIETTVTHASCFGLSDGALQFSFYEQAGSNDISEAGMSSLSAGGYTYFLTNSQGCQTHTYTVINQPPEMVALHETTDVWCFGENNGTVAINAFGGTPGYNISVIPEMPEDHYEPGSYTYTVTDYNGCEVLGAFDILEPQESVITIESLAVIGNSLGEIHITLESFNGTPIVLINEEEASLNNYNLTPGDYLVQVIDDNGCAYEEVVTIELVDTVSEISSAELNVYPNPITKEATLQLQSVDTGSISIYNTQGKEIGRHNIPAHTDQLTLNLEHLNAGVYHMKITSGTTVLETKLVKL